MHNTSNTNRFSIFSDRSNQEIKRFVRYLATQAEEASAKKFLSQITLPADSQENTLPINTRPNLFSKHNRVSTNTMTATENKKTNSLS